MKFNSGWMVYVGFIVNLRVSWWWWRSVRPDAAVWVRCGDYQNRGISTCLSFFQMFDVTSKRLLQYQLTAVVNLTFNILLGLKVVEVTCELSEPPQKCKADKWLQGTVRTSRFFRIVLKYNSMTLCYWTTRFLLSLEGLILSSYVFKVRNNY